jgi:hypothetical protein
MMCPRKWGPSVRQLPRAPSPKYNQAPLRVATETRIAMAAILAAA